MDSAIPLVKLVKKVYILNVLKCGPGISKIQTLL